MGFTDESYAGTISKGKGAALKKYTARYKVSYRHNIPCKPGSVTI